MAVTTNYRISLPRRAESVGIARRVSKFTLGQFGVSPECTNDLCVAVTEACTNSVRHAGPNAADFQLTMSIGANDCEVAVIDSGVGYSGEEAPTNFDFNAPNLRLGMHVMRSVVDAIEVTSMPDCGTVTRMHKRLTFRV